MNDDETLAFLFFWRLKKYEAHNSDMKKTTPSVFHPVFCVQQNTPKMLDFLSFLFFPQQKNGLALPPPAKRREVWQESVINAKKMGWKKRQPSSPIGMTWRLCPTSCGRSWEMSARLGSFVEGPGRVGLGELVGWLLGWLVGLGGLVAWFVGWLGWVGWLLGWLVGWLLGCF